VFPPKKGHAFDVGVMLIMETILGILVALVVYDSLLGGSGRAGSLAAVLVLALPAFVVLPFRPGRYVIIDFERGISRPTWFRRTKVEMIPWREIQSFERIHSLSDRQKVVGLLLRTRAGRVVRYTDRRTPGCVGPILGVLQGHGIREQILKKMRVG